MPFDPPTACKFCSKAAETGSVCNVCRPKNKLASEPISKYANEEWKHLYGRARWRHPQTGLRAAVLRKYPICTECNRAPSTVADHKIDHRGNETLFFDFKNLTGKCDSCHSQKTGSQHGIGKREPSKPGLVNGLIVEYALK
jgi:5-methylcytosine-specific restriction protein A